VLEGHADEVNYVEFSAHGGEVVSSDDKETRFWAVGGVCWRAPEIELDYIAGRASAATE